MTIYLLPVQFCFLVYFGLQDLIVRLCFVLGNLTIKNDSARLKLFQEIDSIETLLNILKTYCQLDKEVSQDLLETAYFTSKPILLTQNIDKNSQK